MSMNMRRIMAIVLAFAIVAASVISMLPALYGY